MLIEYIMKLLTVFGLGAIELWAAIPAGFVFQLHPLEMGVRCCHRSHTGRSGTSPCGCSAWGAVLGTTLGAPVNRLLIWMSFGSYCGMLYLRLSVCLGLLASRHRGVNYRANIHRFRRLLLLSRMPAA